jgi:hypothetical protein
MSESEFIFEKSGHEFRKAAEVFVRKNSRRVAVAPFRLDRVSADALPTCEVEALLVVGNGWSNDMAHHIRLAAAGRAGTVAAEKFERQVSLDAVVPSDGEFGSDFLDGGRLEDGSHAADLVMCGGFK